MQTILKLLVEVVSIQVKSTSAASSLPHQQASILCRSGRQRSAGKTSAEARHCQSARNSTYHPRWCVESRRSRHWHLSRRCSRRRALPASVLAIGDDRAGRGA